MLHYILHTDETRNVSLDELGARPVILLQGLLSPGTHRIPGIHGYKCQVSTDNRGMIGIIRERERPLVIVGIAPNDIVADEMWPPLESCYLKLSDLPENQSAGFAAQRRPKTTPWCASVRMELTKHEAEWIESFERCLARAWIERCYKD